jgi:hypothetical protein
MSGMIACNVYVSAAGHREHYDFLLQLLQQAQRHCQQLISRPVKIEGTSRDPIHHDHGHVNTGNGDDHDPNSTPTRRRNVVAIVHAFCDIVYNRSSFHVAGTPWMVEQVASELALKAIIALSQMSQHEEKDDLTNNPNSKKVLLPHPSVGHVDHIAVMPLLSRSSHQLQDHESTSTTFNNHGQQQQQQTQLASTICGQVAKNIGETLHTVSRVHVLYYGHAHPDKLPLALVRRQSTYFFQSGAPSGAITPTDTATNHKNQPSNLATIGAPTHGFGENCNIRLSAACTQSMAQSLTRHVRERDGGLLGIEALTLPYAHGQWEVACNLLQPTVTTVDMLLERVHEWDQRMSTQQQDGPTSPSSVNATTTTTSSTEQDKIHNLYSVPSPWIEGAYRVGTTEEQCWHVLDLCQTITNDDDDGAVNVKMNDHNRQVYHRLQSYLGAF